MASTSSVVISPESLAQLPRINYPTAETAPSPEPATPLPWYEQRIPTIQEGVDARVDFATFNTAYDTRVDAIRALPDLSDDDRSARLNGLSTVRAAEAFELTRERAAIMEAAFSGLELAAPGVLTNALGVLYRAYRSATERGDGVEMSLALRGKDIIERIRKSRASQPIGHTGVTSSVFIAAA